MYSSIDLTEISKILQESATRCYRDGHVVNGFAMTSPLFFKYNILEDLKKIGAIKDNTRLVDLGCGNGCVNLICALEGIESVGIDNNKDLIEECNKNLRLIKPQTDVTFIHADFRNQDLKDFDLVYSYIEPSQTETIIRLFKEKSHDNARLILYIGGDRKEAEKLARKFGLRTELRFGNEARYYFFTKHL